VSYHQLVEKSNAATWSCNMFAWQINVCLLIIVIVWMEQLHLCVKTYSSANVSLFSVTFFKVWKLLGERALGIEKGEWEETVGQTVRRVQAVV
jgi:hypothetical protein